MPGVVPDPRTPAAPDRHEDPDSGQHRSSLDRPGPSEPTIVTIIWRSVSPEQPTRQKHNRVIYSNFIDSLAGSPDPCGGRQYPGVHGGRSQELVEPTPIIPTVNPARPVAELRRSAPRSGLFGVLERRKGRPISFGAAPIRNCHPADYLCELNCLDEASGLADAVDFTGYRAVVTGYMAARGCTGIENARRPRGPR
jgi:hypothetical protein